MIRYVGSNFPNFINTPVNHLLGRPTTISNRGCNLSCYRSKFGWSFEMALCDYVELVTTVIVISVWAKYFLQTMVTSSGLLHRAKNEQNSTNGNSQASEMYWQ